MEEKSKLLYPELSYKLQGCLFSVYNTLGFGHKEVIYQRALVEELMKKGLSFEREPILAIFYGDKKVGDYRPDFEIDGKIILEIKAVEFLPEKLIIQLVYYLKGTNYQLGYLVNFGGTKIQIVRKIWTSYPENSRKLASN